MSQRDSSCRLQFLRSFAQIRSVNGLKRDENKASEFEWYRTASTVRQHEWNKWWLTGNCKLGACAQSLSSRGERIKMRWGSLWRNFGVVAFKLTVATTTIRRRMTVFQVAGAVGGSRRARCLIGGCGVTLPIRGLLRTASVCMIALSTTRGEMRLAIIHWLTGCVICATRSSHTYKQILSLLARCKRTLALASPLS